MMDNRNEIHWLGGVFAFTPTIIGKSIVRHRLKELPVETRFRLIVCQSENQLSCGPGKPKGAKGGRQFDSIKFALGRECINKY